MTAVPEIARRLIDGVWQTGVAEDSGGGSQPIEVVRLALTPATPNILSGITVYTPSDGDFIAAGLAAVSIPTVWDGNAPQLAVTTPGADYVNGETLVTADLTNADDPYNNIAATTAANVLSVNVLFDGTGPLVVILYKGLTGGDPESTMGTAEVILSIVKAS